MAQKKENNDHLERNLEVDLGNVPESEMTLEKYKRLYLAEKGKNRARKVTAAVGLLIYKAVMCIWMSYELSHWQEIVRMHHHVASIDYGTIAWYGIVLVYVVLSSILDIWFLVHELRKLREFCHDYHFVEYDLIFDAWNLKKKAHMPPPLNDEEKEKINRERAMIAQDLAEAERETK